MLAMFTMRPQPRDRMPPMVALIVLNVPVRFTARVRSQSASGISQMGTCGPTMPALFTTTSTPPISATVAATAS